MSAFGKLLEAAPRYVALLQSQYWPAERLAAYREERLKKTLAAALKIPFYADRLAANPRVEDFAQLPTLRRADVGLLHRSVRSLHPPGSRFACAASSGTSGARAEFIFDRSHQRGRHAARARYLRANGWNPIQRSVWLVGDGFLNSNEPTYDDLQFVSGVLFGVRFMTNSTELTRLAAWIAEFDPFFIYLYPSVLDGLLRSFDSAKLRLPSLRRIYSGAEVLEDSLRDRARRQLGVEISANYGSAEAFLAWQCPAGSYHQNAEHVFIELVDEAGRAVAPGRMGKVLLTTLENHLMPLVRYEIGDYAIAASGACSCGRTLPLLGRIVGRGMNLFRTMDGKSLTTWDLVNVLIEMSEIVMFQIVQKMLDHVVIKYVAENPIVPEIENKVRRDFIPYLGPDVLIDFERVADIARTPGGKFMVTLSEVAQ